MANSSPIGRVFRGIGHIIDTTMKVLLRLVFLLVLIALLLAIFSGPDAPSVPQGGVLVLDLDGSVVEQSPLGDPVSMLLGGGAGGVTVVSEVVDALDRAAGDSRIAGLLLDLEDLMSVNPAHLETIGDALQRFRSTGKPMFAHGAFYSQPQYALASYADTVSLHPLGNLLLPGYGGNQFFFAGLLEKLRVNMHIFRVGTHKAAAEPFMLDSFSEEARQNNQQLVDELWQRYVARIADNRGMTPADIRNYTDNYPTLLQAAGGDMAQLALQQGLVDEVIDDSRLQAQLLQRFGMDDDGRIQTVDYKSYLQASRPLLTPMSDNIGVIVAQGTIMLGEQPRGLIGSDSLGALIRHARLNDRIKAVVLRIDSPGGAALASEMIRQELELLREAGKPLVVSMAGTAASGGYWIATAADQIWASPVTITGSIGVIGMMPTFEDSLAEIGITTDGVGTTPLSLAEDPFSPMSEAMQQILQASVEDAYEKFLQLVADSRGMSLQQVDEIGQGQVWSGSRALELGLIDELGELPQAVEAAAALAGLEEWRVVKVEKALTPGEQLLQQIMNSFGATAASALTQSSSLTALRQAFPLPLSQQLAQSLQMMSGSRLQTYLLCEPCVSLK